MPRYIDADKVTELIRNYGKGALSDGNETLDTVDNIVALVQAINHIPTAEYPRVKHGEWIFYDGYCRCNLCKKLFSTDSNYCGYCGAKMEGEWN